VAASILVNDCGASLPPTEIITGALIDPILTRWSASERLPRAENQCAVRLQLISGLVRIADSRQTSREVIERRLAGSTAKGPVSLVVSTGRFAAGVIARSHGQLSAQKISDWSISASCYNGYCNIWPRNSSNKPPALSLARYSSDGWVPPTAQVDNVISGNYVQPDAGRLWG
jgi:hypothetical protein